MGYFQWVLLLFAAAAVNFFLGVRSLRQFLSSMGSIESTMQLKRFKDMVRVQMYQALIQMALLGGMSVLSVIGIITDRISGGEFYMVLVLNGAVWLAGKLARGTEEKARKLKISAELKGEYLYVCRSWLSRPFPDF